MQTLPERLTNLMDGYAGKIKLGDKIKCQASGPQVVVAPDPSQPNNQMALQVGYQFTLWLDTKLIGQDPVQATGATGGEVAPPPPLIEQIVGRLLEQARQIRANLENPNVATPSAEEMLAGLKGMDK